MVYLTFIGTLCYIQVRQFSRKGMNREIWAYVGLMVFVAVIGSIQMAGVKLPSPAIPTERLFGPMGKWLLRQ